MHHQFNTQRLNVIEANTSLETLNLPAIYPSIMQILSPDVVANLPPYFGHIDTIDEARNWFNRMLEESKLFLVYQADNEQLIGFSFVYLEDAQTKCKQAHLGYLLAQECWGKGIATELLTALLDYCKQKQFADTLIAGVDSSNLSSISLLKKLGFQQTQNKEINELFFHYELKG